MYEQGDRELSPREANFLALHREVCRPCERREIEGASALDLLRMGALQPEVRPQYEERVLRKLRVQTARDTWRYWSPALTGAAIAGVAIISAMQMVSRSTTLPVFRPSGQDARLLRMSHQGLPILLLDWDVSSTEASSPSAVRLDP